MSSELASASTNMPTVTAQTEKSQAHTQLSGYYHDEHTFLQQQSLAPDSRCKLARPKCKDCLQEWITATICFWHICAAGLYRAIL